MNEIVENTLTAYLGPEFQIRLLWQLLIEPEFAEKTFPNIAVEYFDDPNLKRMFIIMWEFYKEFGKVPSLQNKTIQQAIYKYKTPNNQLEEETLFGVLERVKNWNSHIINMQMLYEGEIVQKETNNFIKQQEYRKIGEFIIDKTKSGEIKLKHVIQNIEEKFQKISHIGEEEDDCEEVIDNIDNALRKEFRQTIPTGIEVIDSLTGGGLGKSEIGLILTPSGVGKAQPLSSKILTPTGWKYMRDIHINDDIIGSDGKAQKVLGVFPQGKRPIYKISFNDGTETYCDEEHLWFLNIINQNNLGHSSSILKTTKELYYESNNNLAYSIPTIKSADFNEKSVLINPYLLGLLINNAKFYDDIIKFTITDLKVIDEINNIITKDYPNLKLEQLDITTYSILETKGKENVLFSQTKELGLNVKSIGRFIPFDYKYNSIDNRIALLQGLLDAYACLVKASKIKISIHSKQLAYDVRELVLSLGGICLIKPKKIKHKKSGEKNKIFSYSLTLSFFDKNTRIFRSNNKQSIFKYSEKYNKQISSIILSHCEEAQCIYVSNSDHLYVTDDFILTHNTTLLTKIANTAYEDGKYVAQVIFEDTKDQIKRKHYTIWSGIAQSKLDDNLELARERVRTKIEEIRGNGKLVIKRFSQEDTTMIDIRNWMLTYQKKFGIKFDILVLDYLDCLESHKKVPDRNEAELAIIKSFEALAADFDIPSWSAIQSNRSGFNVEFLEAHNSGGNIKRIQKSHFFMTVAKTLEQKEAQIANISILKARFAKDGQKFQDCIFNNDTLEIRIEDDRYKSYKLSKDRKHNDTEDINKLENKLGKMHASISQFSEATSIDKINDDNINNVVLNDLYEKAITEKNADLYVGDVQSVIKLDENIDKTTELDSNEQNNINAQEELKKIIHEVAINEQAIEKVPNIDIENTFVDPDEPQNEYKTVYEVLNKSRKNQQVIQNK